MTTQVTDTPLVRLTGVGVALPTGPQDHVQAVRDVSLAVWRGQRIGIVGESGSGKSVTGRAIAALLPESKRVRQTGSILVDGHELVGASPRILGQVRRELVSMIFQDPLSSLNPTMKVGRQIAEAVRLDRDSRQTTREAVLAAMALAGLPDPAETAQKYPFQLSGGTRQRVLIAIALAKRPALIIADEPTTALDVTVQARILETLEDVVDRLGTALIMISHDLPVVARLCDYVYVMQKGVVVEHGPTLPLFSNAQHPYTRQLLAGARDVIAVDGDDAVGDVTR